MPFTSAEEATSSPTPRGGVEGGATPAHRRTQVLRFAALTLAAALTALMLGASTASASSWGSPTELSGIPGGGHPTAVSCPAVGACTMVGYTAGGQPFYATETNGQWGTPTELPGAGTGFLLGVSCATAGNCTAVGYDHNNQPFYAAETDGHWSGSIELPNTPGTGYLYAVSCVAVQSCTAVGYAGDGQPAYMTESSGKWSGMTELLNETFGGTLHAVSCVSAGNCTAAGDSGGQQLGATETGGKWSSPVELTTQGGGYLYGVSCVSPGNCTAAGDGSDGQGEPAYFNEVGGQWGTINYLVDSTTGTGIFNGISCAAPGDCTAIGSDSYNPMYATETNGVWGAPTPLSLPPGSSGAFFGVSCVTPTACTAVGVDNKEQPIYASESAPAGPSISATPPSVPADGEQAATITVQSGSTTGGAKVKLKTTLGKLSKVIDNGNGTYTASLTSRTTGSADVSATIDKVPVAGGDAHVTFVTPTPPTVTGVSPSSGPLGGGTQVTITGTGFVSGATVAIGKGASTKNAVAATNVQVISSTEIVATTGSASKAGKYNVRVTVSSEGTSAVQGGDVFTFTG